ncbi:hypothetical protein [Pedobacter sp. V48]|uniref:glycosyl-4,4'-diaponeurosporenoate acyltransferase CrtO family protein n=1 Tax=Pedobacter sp. V48 TaxID=509635 RepID=UPI0003E5901E|nr:hypothetical protein N824_01545 [Pedobacter sp. V48]
MLNQIINLFWTILSFTTVGVYWGQYFAEKRSPLILIVSVVISVLIYVIPNQWLRKLAISNDKKMYERIGVKLLLYVVQNGTLVNRIQRKYYKKPGIIRNRKQAQDYLKTILMQEKFHYCCFTLFLLSAVSAFSTQKPGIGLLIMLCNILYNVYPILLQQYNRLRIQKLLRL